MPHLSVIALSINGGIKTLGAYAGLAAVVALALLALLYFAQARELKRLREWIEHEAQRPRAQAPVRAGAPVPAPPPAPAARLPISPVPLPGAVAPTQAPLVATSVEGVRRVSIADAAAAAGTEVVAPAAPAPASAPDATTVNEPDGLDEAPLPEPPAHPPRLVAGQVDGQEPGSVHEIGEGLVIGRGRGVSIRLTDPLVSGRHARVASDGGGVALEDLGSTNGTFLNGTQLSEPAVLSNGDRIRVGESEFVFESVPMPAPSPLADTTPPTDVPPASGASEPASDADGAALPTDDPSEPRGPSVAVPLLATPVPERTLDIDDADAIEAAPFSRSAMLPPPPAPPPAPHRDSPAITGAVPPPPAPITRVARGLPGDPDRPIESARRARRWRGGAALSGVGLAGRRLVLAGIVAALAAIVLVVVLLGSGGGTPARTSPPAAAGSSTTPAASRQPGAPVARSSITVAVLNGTTTAGLAGALSAKLVGDGFVKGAIADATSQTAATTTVGYTKGNKVAAEEVARQLRISRASVVPVTSTNDATASSAGPHPQVVVTIGVQHPQ